jgi:hypothetical protein
LVLQCSALVQLLLVAAQPQVVLQQGVLPLEAQVLQVLVLLGQQVGQPLLLLAVC